MTAKGESHAGQEKCSFDAVRGTDEVIKYLVKSCSRVNRSRNNGKWHKCCQVEDFIIQKSHLDTPKRSAKILEVLSQDDANIPCDLRIL